MFKLIRIFFIAICVIFAVSVSAQEVGIKGGLNIGNLYIDQIDNESPRFGFHGGIFSRWEVSNSYNLQVELLYSGKGSRATYDNLIDQQVRFNLHYLELPVVNSFRIRGPANLNLGLFGSYLLHASITSDGDLGEYSNDIDREELSDFNFGFIGGIELHFTRIRTGVNYNLGMIKLAQTEASDFLLGDSKTSTVQIYIAFILNK